VEVEVDNNQWSSFMKSWVDTNEYPFESRFFDLPMGKIHFVDEGQGDQTIVMVHGNPSWSFLYRHLIKGLSGKYRCIALDHIGFGLSDKPADWSYLPKEHANNLEALIDNLGLENITLVVQDWGGPIGLSYALKHPQNVKRIIIMNSWMWPMKGDPHFEKFSGFMGGMVGRFLIKNFNFFARVVLKQAFGDKSRLTRGIHNHYLKALESRHDRKGSWVFPKEIIASNDWLTELWEQKDKIAQKPALILWGKKDIAFRDKELSVWSETFTHAHIVKFEDVGHYVQEEKGDALCPIIMDFLQGKNK